MIREPGASFETETERFRLRSLTTADAGKTYVSWWNDADVQKGFNQLPRNWTAETAARNIRGFNNHSRFHLGIFYKKTDKLTGFFTMFTNVKTKTASSNICIGDKSWWGQGAGTEIMTRMVNVMFDDFGMEKIEGTIYGPNAASIAMYKKVGFKQEGLCRKTIISISGGRTDVHLFGLLKEEWVAGKQE